MAASNDAAHGDTAYAMIAPAAGNPGLQLDAGNQADGTLLYVANVDPANAITLDVEGSEAGHRRINLTAKGDYIVIPCGDVVRVQVTANAYPTLVAWAYLRHGWQIGTGSVRTT